jgi:hypothetical protein
MSGIVVSPSIVRTDLTNGVESTEVHYKNETGAPITLVFSLRSIKADVYPKLEFERNEERMLWISTDRDRMTLVQMETGKVKLNYAKELSPGGHYVALVAELSDNLTAGDEKSQVVLQGMLVTPIFVRAKDGNRLEQLIVGSIETPSVLWSYPKEVILLITNKGNVESTPFSKISVLNSKGEVISSGIINESSSLLLPSTTRRYASLLESKSDFVLPGRYEIRGMIQTSESEVEIRHSFLTLGSWHIYVLVGLTLSVLLLVIVIWRSPNFRNRLRYVKLR